MIGEVRISECRCLGDVYIYDLSNVCLGHFAKLSPTIVKKCEVTATVIVCSNFNLIRNLKKCLFLTESLRCENKRNPLCERAKLY